MDDEASGASLRHWLGRAGWGTLDGGGSRIVSTGLQRRRRRNSDQGESRPRVSAANTSANERTQTHPDQADEDHGKCHQTGLNGTHPDPTDGTELPTDQKVVSSNLAERAELLLVASSRPRITGASQALPVANSVASDAR